MGLHKYTTALQVLQDEGQHIQVPAREWGRKERNLVKKDAFVRYWFEGHSSQECAELAGLGSGHGAGLKWRHDAYIADRIRVQGEVLLEEGHIKARDVLKLAWEIESSRG